MIHTHDRDFDNLQGEKYSIAREAYSLSKLCSILFTYKFAGLMKVPEVTANCFPPGVIDTKLLCRAWGGGGSPVGEGASRAVYLTISSEVRAVTGKYFVKDQIDHEVGRGIVLDRGAGPPLRGQ
jgi:NAD(P)-dependent dehydrogenase (short-subunit alcohol dehydrogenase family)